MPDWAAMGGTGVDRFQALLEWLSVYGYPILFGLVFAENAGLPVPGETAVLAAALLASRPEPPMTLVGVVLVTALAAVLGDNLGFWLGYRWARPRLRAGQRFLFLTPGGLQLAEGYFQHYGVLTIFFARFVTGLRVVAAMAAGTSGMHWFRFFVANAAGAATWAIAVSLLGYFFGQSWEQLHRWIGRGALIITRCYFGRSLQANAWGWPSWLCCGTAASSRRGPLPGPSALPAWRLCAGPRCSARRRTYWHDWFPAGAGWSRPRPCSSSC
jgi:membrane protein DedA with SNARE-associated domain